MEHLLIYGLVDPRTNVVRYIGKSSWGMHRPRRHVLPCELVADTHKVHWLKQLLELKLMPQIRILEVVEEIDQLSAAEIRWIAHGHALGWPLTNATPGGDGAPIGNQYALGFKHTEEQKAQFAERMIGNQYAVGTVRSIEWKGALSTRMLGNKHALGYHHTPEWREEQAARMRGKHYTAGRVVPEDERIRRAAAVQAAWDKKSAAELAAHAAKISAAKQGSEGNIENLKKGWTPEVHAKAIAASADLRRGVPETNEHRQAISDGLKKAYAEGRRVGGHSEETKAKISASKMGRGPTKEEVWAKHGGACQQCNETLRPHKGNGLCSRCWQTDRNSCGVKPLRWSRDRDACSRCEKSDSPHKSKGICSRCYQAERRMS